MDRQVRLFQQHAFGIQRLELGQLRQVGDLVLALIGGGALAAARAPTGCSFRFAASKSSALNMCADAGADC
ncbi:MAG: hypothetical protein ACPIFP_04125, partial [Candidatus Poseidoniaceae archaeon]